MDNLVNISRSSDSARLDSRLQNAGKVSTKKLINTLNYLNFQDGDITVNLRHGKYGNVISLKARPDPCLGEVLDCRWAEGKGLNLNLERYEFLHFLITGGRKLMLARPELRGMAGEGISFNLKDACGYEINSRKVRRHPCEGVQAELIQNGMVFQGRPLDFSAVSFCLEVFAEPPQSFHWVNTEATVVIIFKQGHEILYSGECGIIRHNWRQDRGTFVLRPVSERMRRFRPKEFRSLRHRLSPLPMAVFSHPFTGRMTNLQVEDLSGAGFSVEERREDSVLLPGMIIPELEIEFGGDFVVRNKAQVIYRIPSENGGESAYVKCGVAFLDMDFRAQVRLSSLLHQATDEKTHVCNRVDPDALWEFFFKTGFFYPRKYAAMHPSKEKVKETYRKLYLRNPEIARHFIYQDRGVIKGHVSMLRCYENTWLFHHHAADREDGDMKAGLAVLEQVGRYVNDFYSLYSSHMRFVISFFRPENRFPNRVFGGFAEHLNDPEGCSIDSFAYFVFTKPPGAGETSEGRAEGDAVELVKTRPEDLIELESFYGRESGGLMLKALELEPETLDMENLSREYRKLSLKRERHVFSLLVDGGLKALVMVNLTDFGLNLSNLINSIYVIVLDSDGLDPETLHGCLPRLMGYFEEDEVPVLLYPVSYAVSRSLAYERIYNMYILNIPYSGDKYLSYMEGLLRHGHRE